MLYDCGNIIDDYDFRNKRVTLLVNKNKFNVSATKKVLHKIGKHWVTVSVVILGLMGTGMVTGSTHAATMAPSVNVTRSANRKPMNSGLMVQTNQTNGQSAKQTNVNAKPNNQKTVKNKTVTKPVRRVQHLNPNRTVYLKVPYVSQWRPISAPEGCAEASLTMLLRYDHKHVNLSYIYSHLPQSYQMRGGQSGNAYGTNGFGHVIKAGALTRYAHHWDKNVHNISGASIHKIKNYVQNGHPVLFYGYSSYQLPGDPNRNHCKVITAYRHGYFRVYDPLYYSKYGQPGTQGRNMMFDRGAVSWYSLKRFNYEYAHIAGSNRKSALTVVGTPHFEHTAKKVRKRTVRRVRKNTRKRSRAAKSRYPSLSHYSAAEKALANRKYNYSVNAGRKTSNGRAVMKTDREINPNEPFNKKNYEMEYLYALNHPALIDGAQDHLGGMMTGIKDGLNDYGQYAGVNATKQYAKQHHQSNNWLKNNLVINNKRGFYYWYFMGFNDNNGGDASNAARNVGHDTLTAYHEGLHKAQTVKNSKPTRRMINYTKNHLSNTILSNEFDQLF